MSGLAVFANDRRLQNVDVGTFGCDADLAGKQDPRRIARALIPTRPAMSETRLD